MLAGGDERDPDIGQQHDRRAAGGETVEAVGEVDRCRRPGDHEVDEHRVQGPEVDRNVTGPDQDGGCDAGLLRGYPPQAHRDQHGDHELAARAQPERAALDDLGVVVGEAHQGASDARSEHPDRLPVAG